MKSEAELNEIIIKMIACFQVGIEHMDEFAGSKLYRQGVKFHAKALAIELEGLLNVVQSQIADTEDEETYLNIERGIREFVSKPLKDIYLIGERDQMISSCSAHAREMEWDEEETNKRMDVIGQNGNTGEHYDEYKQHEQLWKSS